MAAKRSGRQSSSLHIGQRRREDVVSDEDDVHDWVDDFSERASDEDVSSVRRMNLSLMHSVQSYYQVT